jgi:hypothetical protein
MLVCVLSSILLGEGKYADKRGRFFRQIFFHWLSGIFFAGFKIYN